MGETDYYELLGVDTEASAAEIKSAYRALVRATHPDAGGSADTFQRLRDAYETLHDPARRSRYDRARTREAVPQRTDPARERRARRARFGDDPGFVAELPDIAVADIPWWFEIDPHEPVSRSYQRPPGHAPLTVVCGGLLVLVLPAALPVELVTMLATWLVALLVTCGVSFWITRGLLHLVRAERAFDAEFGTGIVHGTPGTEPEQWNERLTDELLSEYFPRLPGVRIFHGLGLPGSVFADIDHAVLRGDRLVLVESKAWLPGHYGMTAGGVLTRNGQRFRGGSSNLDQAVAAYRALLPHVEVRGAVVIHPSRSGEITTDRDTTAGRVVTPMTPRRFVADIGSWLADQPAAVDVTALRAVLDRVV